MMGISSYNFKSHVASDIGEHGQYLEPENLKSPTHLDWQLATGQKKSKLN